MFLLAPPFTAGGRALNVWSQDGGTANGQVGKQMFLVTDVSGHVGKAVVAELARQSVAVRVLTQDPSEAAGLPPGVEAVRGSVNDTRLDESLFTGVEAVFAAAPLSPQMADVHRVVVNAAKAAGVTRIVQLSGVGADASFCCARVLRWLGQAENTAGSGDLQVTRLRPTTLLQNLIEFAPTIAHQGLLAGPFRNTRWAWVDARDVATVAVEALRNPIHAGRTYTVTGAESLSYQEVVERISRVIGKPVRYLDITANEARGWLQAKGASPVMIEAKLEMWDACASNLINSEPTNVVQEVTGRAPRSVEDFVRDYSERFLHG
jgi:uncharacterized protein YbjT (DUF2867 family)